MHRAGTHYEPQGRRQPTWGQGDVGDIYGGARNMTLDDVMNELAEKATPTTKATHMRHGAPEPLFGVRIGDLKPLQKKLKGRQELALLLYATGNSDAMYLAGLIADGSKMTRKQLDEWAAGASWHMISACSVAWVAAEHPHGIAVAKKWIGARRELTAIAGWSTLSAVTATIADANLPVEELGQLLDEVSRRIAAAPDRVRYAMNGYIISCGTYVAPLADKAIAVARSIGKVEVDMGATACQVPDAESTIIKSRRAAPVAAKRKTARC